MTARGALVIDLGKRKRGGAGKAIRGAVETVASWNAENPTHPRKADGEFVKAVGAGHEAVADLLHGMMAKHGGEDTPLGKALLGVIGRDAPVRAPKAKPLKRGAPAGDGTSESLFGPEPLRGSHARREQEEAKVRAGSSPSESELNAMTVAQLQERYGKLRGRTKKEKITNILAASVSAEKAGERQQARKAKEAATARENALAIQGTERTGKTVWEMTDAERDAHFEAERAAGRERLDSDNSEYLGPRPPRDSRAIAEAAALRAANDPKAQLRRTGRIKPSGMPAKFTGSKTEPRFGDTQIGALGEDGKPLNDYRTLAERQNDRVKEMVADPKPEHREELKTMLSGMTVAEIKALSDVNGGTWISSGTKAQKIDRVVENLVGFRLNSRAIRGGVWTDKDQGTGRKMSPNPRKANTWGNIDNPGEVHYHSGAIGYAADQLGADTQLEVRGDSLVNQLDRIATDTTMGRTSPAQQIEELKKLHNELPDGPGRRAVAEAIGKLDVPVKPAPVTVPEGAPKAARELVNELAKIPFMSRDDGGMSYQAKALWDALQGQLNELAARQQAGRNLKIFWAGMEHSLVTRIPHESQEGAAGIRALITAKMKELGELS